MNLDIQQAWCRHWVRERLDIHPSGSLVLWIVDAQKNGASLTRKHRQRVDRLKTELRWHFSHPLFVLLSIVDGPMQNNSMSGIVDEHTTVDNATDLCGWVGAANSLLLLSSQLESGQSSPILEALSQVATAFRKPCNRICLEDASNLTDPLNWERLHQASVEIRASDRGIASIDFVSATRMLEEAFEGARQASATAKKTDPGFGFRHAG